MFFILKCIFIIYHHLDVNECDMKNQDLCGNGNCINTIGSFSCHCEDGYSSKSEDNPYCSDEDECILDIHNCDKNAMCINNPVSEMRNFAHEAILMQILFCFPFFQQKIVQGLLHMSMFGWFQR